MRGKAKATSEHIKDGTFRADRHGDRLDHLEFGGCVSEPPDWLNELAKKRWRDITECMPPDCLRASDSGILAMHCVVFAQYQEQQAWLEMMNKDDEDYYKHTMIAVMLFSKAYESMQRLGLTPIDRIKLKAPHEDKSSKPDGLSRLKLVTAENA